jgi:DNA-directed RNA polymerase alpha subunit
MRTYEDLKEAILASTNESESLKITNELLLDIRELLKPKKKEKAEVDNSEVEALLAEYVNEPLNEELSSISVQLLPFSSRTKNCLRLGNIKTLGELSTKSYRELSMIRNMGRNSIAEIKDLLAQYNIRMDFPKR